MSWKSISSRAVALLLVVVMGLVGCSSSPGGLTGNYPQDTLAVIENITNAIDTPTDAANRQEVNASAREQINDYVSRYRRNSRYSGSRSFTTMQTALNSLAGFYSTYGNRPVSEKLKKRLKQEFKQVEFALQRGA